MDENSNLAVHRIYRFGRRTMAWSPCPVDGCFRVFRHIFSKFQWFLTCFLTSIHHSFFPNFSLYTGNSFSFIYRFRKKDQNNFQNVLFGRFGSIWTRRGSGFCIFGTIYCFLFFSASLTLNSSFENDLILPRFNWKSIHYRLTSDRTTSLWRNQTQENLENPV